MSEQKQPWGFRFQAAMWSCGFAAFLVRWGIISGWPLVTGAGVTTGIASLVMLAASGIGLFSDGFMDRWEREE